MAVMATVRSNEAIGAEQFRLEMLQRIAPLRRSLGQFLVELGAPRTPTALQRRLGVAYAICWQIFRVVHSDDVCAEAQHAPSPGSLKRLLAVAVKQGLSAETIEAVQTTAEAFQQFIEQHAEDRGAFDSMVAGATSAQKSKNVLVQRRRAAYRAMSHVWGVQTDLFLVTGMVRRCPDDLTKTEIIWMSLQQGIRRLRSDAHVTLMGYQLNAKADDGEVKEDVFGSHALDHKAAALIGMPALPEFSSKPFPEVELITLPSGWRLYNMVGRTVGLRSNFDVAAGYYVRDVPMMVESSGRRQGFLDVTTNRKPVALVVMDLLLHRDSFPGVKVDLMVHQHQDGAFSLEAARRTQQFPHEERVAMPGRGDSIDLPEVARYPEMLRYATSRVGWDLADFDVYRVRMPFPIMGTTTRMFFYDPVQ